MEAAYKTVAGPGRDEFVEQRSRFIGYVCPVTTEAQALAFIEEKKKKHWDATHNVYAYILREGGVQRFSDDGEPHGTAGVPTLDVLQKSGVTDVCVVVTRYFGGILLGAGGLVRAYSRGASIALAAGGIVTMEPCLQMEIVCDYSRYSRIASLIGEKGGVVDKTEYEAQVRLVFHLPPRCEPAFRQALADATCGDITPSEIGCGFFAAGGNIAGGNTAGGNPF